jgi:hypothetical protein
VVNYTDRRGNYDQLSREHNGYRGVSDVRNYQKNI